MKNPPKSRDAAKLIQSYERKLAKRERQDARARNRIIKSGVIMRLLDLPSNTER